VLFPDRTWAQLWGDSPAGTSVFLLEPLFRDESHFDFRVQGGSPARGFAGPVVLEGALPASDVGLFPATLYWEPELDSRLDLALDETESLSLPLRLARAHAAAPSLRFQLLEPSPPAAQIDTATRTLRWTPNEANGPGSVAFHVLVVANDTPLLSSQSSFHVTVNEVNRAPVLAAVPDQTVDELMPLTLELVATDPDLPVNALAFSLVSGPAGLTVSPSGQVAWTPTEAQGPSANVVVVTVVDDGSPALQDSELVAIGVQGRAQSPVLTGAQVVAGKIQFQWEAQVGRCYRVQVKDDLSAGKWTELVEVQAVGAVAEFAEPLSNGEARYYRVEAVE